LTLGGNVAAEEFGLFEDGLGGFFLFVGRIAVFAEDALDHGAEFGFDAFFVSPVDGGVFVDGVDEFAGDGFEGVVAEDSRRYR
jgi:hypothetical protein